MSFIEDLFGIAYKTALVTGGNRGIGAAIAEGFVRAGARVFITGRDAVACEETAIRLRTIGSCIALPGDLATDEGRTGLANALSAQVEQLDILVNNAGAIWAAPIDTYPESGWDKVYNLNVKANFFLIQKLLPLLAAAASPDDPARIINVGSVNALRIPSHETYAYVSSKAALHQLTRHLAGQLAPRSITANVLAPGYFPSKMLAADIERRGEEEVAAPVPLKRLSTPHDMMGAALFLSSRAGAYLTGAVIPVDGGMATTI